MTDNGHFNNKTTVISENKPVKIILIKGLGKKMKLWKIVIFFKVSRMSRKFEKFKFSKLVSPFSEIQKCQRITPRK